LKIWKQATSGITGSAILADGTTGRDVSHVTISYREDSEIRIKTLTSLKKNGKLFCTQAQSDFKKGLPPKWGSPF